jgi:hypothetical protein
MTRNDIDSQLKAVWTVLCDWRLENPSGKRRDHVEIAWANACQAMDWITEDLEAAYHGAIDPRSYDER